MKHLILLQDSVITTDRLSTLASLVTAMLLAASGAYAQDYPTRPIRLVVPFAPGGGTDLLARTIAQKLNDAWGKPVVVDHRTGGTGAVGTGLVAKASPDGYTLLIVTNSTHVIAPSLITDLPFDPVKDFNAITIVATGPNVLVAHPSVPANSIKELVALAKARPAVLNYASPGQGSSGHMAAELFKMVTGTDIVHVPYKGAAAALTDLLGGHVQLYFSGPAAVIPHLGSRKIKALAVAYPRRTAGLDDVPTFIEAGYPAVEGEAWFGLLTTAGTPRFVIDKLNREVVRIMLLPEVRERFLTAGLETVGSSPQQFSQLIRADLAKWQRVVKASGIRAD